VVVDEWRLANLGLTPTDQVLSTHDIVWAIPLGENAWQVEVETFLLGLSDVDVMTMLAEADR
jgi:polar amino acid transport system substrate-binding protein